MSTRYRLTIMILLAVLLAGVNAQAGVTVKGSVFGGGNQADVKINTTVNISAGHVCGNVYGGGSLGYVGKFTISPDGRDYTWQEVNDIQTGTSKVNITGGTIGSDTVPDKGNVFGGGRGSANNFKCDSAMVDSTNVNISNATVYGSVYGGGEIARVERNTTVTIGIAGTDTTKIKGNVFGGGKGLVTHGYSALVRGNTYVTIQGEAVVDSCVYGGGELASTGKYSLDANNMPYSLVSDNLGICRVDVKNNATIKGNLFGAGKGLVPRSYTYTGTDKPRRMTISDGNSVWDTLTTDSAYLRYVQTLAIVTRTYVTVDNSAKVKGSVYGGSESGFVQHYTDVTIQGNSVIGTSNANGDVFGGGLGLASFAEAGKVSGNTALHINGGTVYGSVYGGGKLGYVGTFTTDGRNYTWQNVNDSKTGICSIEITGGTIGSEGVYGKGNVFGGGQGLANTFQCEKAMVDSTYINISNGRVNGSVYGGGEIARVERNTAVTIGNESGSDTTRVKGNVFGGGKGLKTHGYSALVRGNPIVIIQGDAKIDSCVYGGGEIASVGKYKVKTNVDTDAPSWLPVGMPYSLDNGGKCSVIIRGNAEIGPNDMTMTAAGGPIYSGNVFGGGKGVIPHVYSYQDTTNMPRRMMAYSADNYNNDNKDYWAYSDSTEKNVWEYFNTDSLYLTFIETMALAKETEVTVDGNAFIKGSVYGGSENGIVKQNTHVIIKSGQIGAGYDGDHSLSRYDNDVFIDPALITVTDGNAQKACASWTYTDNGYTYDKFADADGDYAYTGIYANIPEEQRLTSTETSEASKGGRPTATDGHTFYGNVFGGGSGYFPYAPGKWHREAGNVGGNTQVDIEGGHILSSVYGGNEQTDIGSYTWDENNSPIPHSGGKCTVNMSGGTIGVPRTKTQIENNPVIGNLFGAGKGDKRLLFNTWTNVIETKVNITGGIVYGSVFGGGEDGHVMNNDTVIIEQTSDTTITIGSTGLSGADGNVYGGGRGSETALTAGVIGGNVSLEINSGTIKGSVYGGGRLASVGTNFVNPDYTDLYGKLQEPATDHGNITININGGTIGSPNTDGSINGNIFGGSKGTAANSELGIVRSTTINMTGGTAYASVYGGGALGNVAGGTHVNLTGGTIYGYAYGGGLGQIGDESAGTDSVAAIVGGDVTVNLNNGVATSEKGCVVSKIFGGNNLYGTPKGSIYVNIYATQHKDSASISGKKEGIYDMLAVYGGGNLAAYEPTSDTASTHVTIGDCHLTSIQQVYGGGNAASAPATNVIVTGTFEIDEVFGGGNGKDSIIVNGVKWENPGANVGYKQYAFHVIESGDTTLVVNDDAKTKDDRIDNDKYVYGTGIALTEIYGGKIHYVYGGSNSLGNIRKTAISIYENQDLSCPVKVDQTYGGGKNADMDGTIEMHFDCLQDTMAMIFGGARNADVNSDIVLNITNGSYRKVFGGNNEGGAVNGSITVNINEDGCQPIRIGELYGGGYLAPYSIYGYKTDASGNYVKDTQGKLIVLTKDSVGALSTPHHNPRINVIAADSIGVIYGGGYQAVMVGTPYINVNMKAGKVNGVTNPIGHIDTIYGGGNLANVIGDTHIEIGTRKWVVVNDAGVEVEVDTITRNDANIRGDIFGGGNNADVTGNTYITINNGSIGGNIYGGGKMGSVGIITDSIIHNVEKPADGAFYSYGLSWPYQFNYVDTTGITNIDITNGTAVTGNVFGGGKGKAAQRYIEAHFGNVRETHVNIGQNDDSNHMIIGGSVYGGGDDGHVYDDARVTIYGGTISGSVYGGGNGTSTYKDSLRSKNGAPLLNQDVHSITAGKVYGNTYVTMYDGFVNKNIYGGGNLASVGKGNYAGGTDDYSTSGYGELPAKVNGNESTLWTDTLFTKSGKATVKVIAGTVGVRNDLENNTATGNVFGSSRGMASIDVGQLSPRIKYVPDFFLGYVNNTEVEIGDASHSPIIFGSVYGGGQDGHVRNNTHVIIRNGEIGQEIDGESADTLATLQWLSRGNVFGAGSGISRASDNNFNYSSGSVTNKTVVDILGGQIYQNVYGGGALASVGPPFTGTQIGPNGAYDEDSTISVTRVNIKGGTIGNATNYAAGYGGDVFGASRGNATLGLDSTKFATTLWSKVVIDSVASILGSVYGGGESGLVKHSSEVCMNAGTVGENIFGGGQKAMVGGNIEVNINGGTVTEDVYGGGALANTNVNIPSQRVNGTYGLAPITGAKPTPEENNPYTYVNLNGGTVHGDIYGGGLGQLTPDSIEAKVFGNVTVTTIGGSAQNVFGGNNLNGAPQGQVTVHINGTAAPTVEKPLPIGNIYGGGNLATYTYADKDHPLTVLMEAGTVDTIFGGGNKADVAGSIVVTVSGGRVVNDVYGGGALANTNTANWDSTKNSGAGGWADGMFASDTTRYNTRVYLNGGVIGNAYGGALGDTLNPAFVFGDVIVILDGASLPADTDRVEYDTVSDNRIVILKHGSVFGCNNINGTPKGKVEVNVLSTSNSSGKNTKDTDNKMSDRFSYYYDENGGHDYIDVAKVFGGGNAADYKPVTNQAPKVIVDGCSDVSVGYVYGGGNAAAVPATDVEVKGAYYLRYVFGGGFGAGSDNKGANVGYMSFPLDTTSLNKSEYLYGTGSGIGTTSVKLAGGYIDNVFGGSDTKGEISDSVSVIAKEEALYGCPLKVGSLYGGGRKATMNTNIITQIDCPSGNIANVYGGSEMADINGNVTLNILAGEFDEVFGGNRMSGNISGYITVNIEETEYGCQPIIIGTLYGGCDLAPYQGSANDEGYNITVNAKAFTRIGEIYGGSKGDSAKVIGNTVVNINQVKGFWADSTYNSVHIPDSIGRIGNVFGGGDRGKVIGNTVINICTVDSVGFITEPTHLRENPGTELPTDATGLYLVPVAGARITGNVYGGGNLADVTGNTYVNIGSKEGTGDTYTSVTFAPSTPGITIGGNVFGGGKGKADEFFCAKAMVGIDGAGVTDLTDGGTRVTIGNGTINGTVYGGGEIGRVEKNSKVTVGFGDGGTNTSAPVINGNLFGAGKGVATHGYSALLRGNPTVIVQGDAKVKGSVYGGGEIASVARYNVPRTQEQVNQAKAQGYNAILGVPYALRNSTSGYCTVIIRGHAVIGPDEQMQMTAAGGPDDKGHVFGGGKGILPADSTFTDRAHMPRRMNLYDKKVYTDANRDYWEYVDVNDTVNVWEYYAADNEAYHTFIQSLALASQTDVTIGQNAFVKGSVYGGSMDGIVQYDTKVTIADNCQIGCGEGKTVPYTSSEWANENPADFTECAHWPYASPYAPYDIYKDSDADGQPDAATNGYTFYGNVFGGGSGYYPYKRRAQHELDSLRNLDPGYADGIWHRSAGLVRGNTVVNITGGHILTNVYGGNEQTDVEGNCTINMSGGTVGVPRTVAQAQAHPVTCYVFGAGKGDPRINFNTWTNVDSVTVNITGGRIFGSVFGGGEDGHVLSDVKLTINEDSATTKIGTTGTSYVDGNVFGGGRGFSGDAQTAGTVGGNIEVNIESGTMLGSVYGGGRLASVGTLFTSPEAPNYGNFVEDDSIGTYGHVTVNISGGTIGNSSATGEGAKHSGNVFGGSMGRLTLINGTTNPIWPRMAQVKETNVNIYGTAVVLRSVYGGGELGTVRDNAYVTIGGIKTADVNENGYVDINDNPTEGSNCTVGCDVYGGGYGSEDMSYTVINVHEPKGNVTTPSQPSDYELHTYAFTPMQFAGCVGQNTYVHIVGGRVKKSVYGGGELASVGIINCRVDTINKYNSIENVPTNKVAVPYGNKWITYSNMVKHTSTKEDGAVYDFGLSWPYEFQYVPGFDGKTHVHITGGRIGLTKAEDDNNPFEDFDNGDVCGGGKGKAGDYNDYVFCANVGSTEVHIKYPSTPAPEENIKNYLEGNYNCIAGAVYGGAENGHVMGDTKLKLENGLIGHSIYGGGSGKGTFERRLLKIGATKVENQDYADTDYDTCIIYSIMAGKVFGNTEIEMIDGYVVRNVYGGGNMGSVGKGNYSGGSDDYSVIGYGELPPENNQILWTSDSIGDFPWHFLNSGKCIVTIKGGTIGYIDSNDPNKSMYPLGDNKPIAASLPYGNVFGGCRGIAAPNIGESPRYLYCPESFMGFANETSVTIGTKTGGPHILGSVYGGGQDGHIRRDTYVTINNGKIGLPFTDEEDANGLKYRTLFGKTDTTTLNDELNNLQWLARGNVYGAGSGIGEYKYDFNYDGDYEDKVTYTNPQIGIPSEVNETGHSTSAGSVTRFTYVEIKGGTIYRNVYGGGSIASVGAPKIPPADHDAYYKDNNSGQGEQSLNEVIISGGQIGDAESHHNSNHNYGGNVYGASRGQGLGPSFSTSIWTDVTVNGGTITGNVYGGGEKGTVKQGVNVNINGGILNHDVYGGGALASTNTSVDSTTVPGKYIYPSTTVNITGGRMHNIYGGGLGSLKLENDSIISDVEAFSGNVTVNLNSHYAEADTVGAIVDSIFGANNLNGTPLGHIKVHVYATQNASKASIEQKYPKRPVLREEGHKDETEQEFLQRLIDSLTGSTTPSVTYLDKVDSQVLANAQSIHDKYVDSLASATFTQAGKDSLLKVLNDSINAVQQQYARLYDVAVVFGGGNLAPYIPANIDSAEVIIDGCGATSIHQVYGGGNAASVPSTYVVVNGTYEIDEVFGGGNGNDPYVLLGNTYMNPGANVGYFNYTHFVKDNTTNIFKPVDNPDAATREQRAQNYSYDKGSGVATTQIRGGKVHTVYGGSNEKGNIRTTAVSVYDNAIDDCPIEVDETYGGGKNAAMDGKIVISLDCVKDMDVMYGGSKNADVYNDIVLNVTNGTFKQVFGGNNVGGAVYGSITINIEEKGCQPIEIDELYGGGYLAPYSIYGYEKDATTGLYKYYLVDEDNNYVKDGNGQYILSDTTHGKLMPLEAIGQPGALSQPVNDPRINIISATRISNTYGGGYKAKMVGSPHINVNMQDGRMSVKKKIDHIDNGDTIYKYIDVKDSIYLSDDLIRVVENGDTLFFTNITRGRLGNIYGGGFEAEVAGNTYIDIGTGQWLNDSMQIEAIDRNEAEITGYVFGGGDHAAVTGNTNINFANGQIDKNIYGGGNLGAVGTISTVTNPLTGGIDYQWAENTGATNITISGGTVGLDNIDSDTVGNVFGAGKGSATSFECENAMVDTATVIISNGTVYGSVYGGGEIGRVEHNTSVTLGEPGVYTSAPYIRGNVFGGGAGVETHGYSALVRGNSFVTIQGGAKVGLSVYGGGEIASVGKYKIKRAQGNPADAPDDAAIGMPYALAYDSLGNCSVTIKDSADIAGDVFGAGKGKKPDHYDYTAPSNTQYHSSTYDIDDHMPKRMMNYYDNHNPYYEYYNSPAIWEYFESQDKYLTFIETLALTTTTDVTIGGDAQVKGSVYGGSKNAFVQFNTSVTIGDNAVIGTAIETQEDTIYTNGNVFGGGLGLVSFAEAGRVRGNTNVTINDGTMYGSVYGGGALGDVGKITKEFIAYNYTWNDSEGHANGTDSTKNTGVCTVLINGGTITGDVFGASQGSDSTFWCEKGMVYSTDVSISNGTVNGDVYGGGEIARVESDTKVTIGDTLTNSAPHILGNVFGGGSGLATHGYSALTRGNTVVTVQSNAKIEQSVYGGGEIATVGRFWVKGMPGAPTPPAELPDGMPYQLRSGGRATVNIQDNAEIVGNVFGAGMGKVPDNVDYYSKDDYIAIPGNIESDYVLDEHMPKRMTTYDPYDPVNDKGTHKEADQGKTWTFYDETDTTHRFVWEYFDTQDEYHTFLQTLALINEPHVTINDSSKVNESVYGGSKSGFVLGNTYTSIQGNSEIGNDVYGGGLGLDSYAEAGRVSGNTEVTITGGFIKHNVYGGGELGSVGTITSYTEHNTKPAASDSALYDFALSWPVEFVYKPNTGNTNVEITGGRIGTSGDDNGDVFGGSKGKLFLDWEAKGIDLEHADPVTDAALIMNIQKAFRFEEAQKANVNNSTVTVNIPTTGIASLDDIITADSIWDTDDLKYKLKLLIDAQYERKDYDTDGVYGIFSYPQAVSCITGSVYGGSENGHVNGNTNLTITDGIVGHSIYGGGKGKGTYAARLYNVQHAELPASEGGQYKTDHSDNPSFKAILNNYIDTIYSLTAGKVYGNTNVTMMNGYIMRSVFGGGNLGSVGKGNYSGGIDDYSLIGYGERPESDDAALWDTTDVTSLAYQFMNSGKTKVIIEGGQIGYILPGTNKFVNGHGGQKDIAKLAKKDDLPTGNVFGACRGQSSPNGNVSPRYMYIPDFFLGYVNETEVIIGSAGSQPVILGSVYGGGQDGHVRRGTKVTINNAEIGIEYSESNRRLLNKKGQLDDSDITDLHWKGRGNVFGAGSGLGTYGIKDPVTGIIAVDSDGDPIETDYNYSSGSVTCTTDVIINDAQIHQNVYGGGSLASVGPPNTGQVFSEYNTTEPYTTRFGRDSLKTEHKSTSSTNVIINGGTIGDAVSFAAGYGGNVFGASRGNISGLNLRGMDSRYGTSIWTSVKANQGHIYGNVFGGGEAGTVGQSTKVVLGDKVVESTPGSSSSGAPLRPIPAATQPNAVAPAVNINNSGSSTSTPANVATEAPDARSIRTNRANQ